MNFTVQATYENGTLRLSEPLPLKEHEKVTITVQPVVSIARQTAGMLGWKGDAETLEGILAESEEN